MSFEQESYEMDWLEDSSDNMLIYADAKVGKTTLASEMLKNNLDADPDCVAFVVNTDKGFTKPAKYVGLDDPKYKDRIKYFFVNQIQRAIDVMNHIRCIVEKRNNPNDTILFDLLSWSWDESQKEFVNELSGGEVVGYLSRAMKDPKKFGQFEGMQWGYIKKVEDMVSNYLTRNPICQVIALARVKDVSVSYKMSGKKPDLWYHIGKPDTRKDIMHEFATVVKIEKYRDDEGNVKRKFIVVASRDGDPDYKWYGYTTPDNFVKQIDNLLGGREVKQKPLKDDTPTEADIMKSMVGCIKENFSDADSFKKDDVIELCGYPEYAEKILKQAVDAGRLFYIENTDEYSFKSDGQVTKEEVLASAGVETEEPEAEEPVKESMSEDALEKTEALIPSLYDSEGVVNVNDLINKMKVDGVCETAECANEILSALLDEGLAFEPEANMIKLINEPKKDEEPKEEESPEEPEEETPQEETTEEDDDGWT